MSLRRLTTTVTDASTHSRIIRTLRWISGVVQRPGSQHHEFRNLSFTNHQYNVSAPFRSWLLDSNRYLVSQPRTKVFARNKVSKASSEATDDDDDDDSPISAPGSLDGLLGKIDFKKRIEPKVIEFIQKYDYGILTLTSEDCAQLPPAEISELSKVCGQLKSLKELYDQLSSVRSDIQDIQDILLGMEKERGTDQNDKQQFEAELEDLSQEKRDLEIHVAREIIRCVRRFNSGNPNENNVYVDKNEPDAVVVEIRAGAGGDESMIFTEELVRLYERLGGRKRWKVHVLSTSPGLVAGFREAVVKITGPDVYETLKYEAGVHRVQRVPATESGGRVHSSTISIAVMPFDSRTADSIKVDLHENDMKIETMRSSGAGGQNVNKVETAVRITHIPSGMVVTCQEYRTQLQNKETAKKLLLERLMAKEITKLATEQSQARRDQLGVVAGERSDRIRTYNFLQTRVTDHRVPGLTICGCLDDIMNGGNSFERLVSEIHEHFERQEIENIIRESFS